MTPMIRNLSLLLAAQLVLAGLLNLDHGRGAAAGGPLLAFDPGTVDALRIEDGDGDALRLERDEETWTLPAAEGFPADGERITKLLERLAALEAGPPVARSAEARERFRVADDAFERRLTLEAGGDRVAELRLGRSRDTRRVHGRAGDGDTVVVVDLPTWELPTARRDWLDQSRLRIAQDDVVAVEADGVRIERDPAADDATGPGAWRLTGPVAPALRPDADAVDDLVRRLATLRVEDVLGSDAAPPAEDARVVVLETAGGRRLRYALTPPAEGGAWTLQTSLRPERFRVTATSAEPIVAAARADGLLTEEGGSEAEGEAEPG